MEFYLHRLKNRNPKSPPILIYQMGKVGSSSILRSLSSLELDNPIYHVHVLTDANLQSLDHTIRASFPHFPYIPKHLIVGEWLRRQIKKSTVPRWKIITLIRDPIARNLSSFFQDLRTRHHYLDTDAILSSDMSPETVETIADAFMKNHDHIRPLQWLDMELNRVFNCDIYSVDYPKEKGYMIYSCDNADILLLKLEMLNECISEAMDRFLGLKQFDLINANISGEKKYYHLYKGVGKALRFSLQFLDLMYTSKFVRHFYTQQEIDNFEKRWNRHTNRQL